MHTSNCTLHAATCQQHCAHPRNRCSAVHHGGVAPQQDLQLPPRRLLRHHQHTGKLTGKPICHTVNAAILSDLRASTLEVQARLLLRINVTKLK